MRDTVRRKFQMAHAKLPMRIRLVREWVCERSPGGSKRKEVVFSDGNGDEPRLGQYNSGSRKSNKTDFSPRVRPCCGVNSTALPLSPASQNLKPLEEAAGRTFVVDNTKTCPV